MDRVMSFLAFAIGVFAIGAAFGTLLWLAGDAFVTASLDGDGRFDPRRAQSSPVAPDLDRLATRSRRIGSPAIRHIAFSVSKMTCTTCPYIVRRALANVSGVRSVNVEFHRKTATVVVDRGTTDRERLIAAARNVGIPPRLMEARR